MVRTRKLNPTRPFRQNRGPRIRGLCVTGVERMAAHNESHRTTVLAKCGTPREKGREMHSSKLHSSKRQGLLIIFSAALVWPLSACSHSAVSEGTATVPVVPAARVVRTDLRNSITLTAEFEPFYEVDVMAKEAGYIKHMLVDIGDRVKEGQLLATLEIPELQADLTKAKSDVQTANAERAVAKGDLQRAQAASQIAQLSYSRIQDVSKKEPGLVPLQEVDVAHSHNLEADAQVSAALQRVQAAESRYQSAVAGLAHEAALVEYTRIVAPFSGVVTQRYASDGAMIQAGIASQTQAMPVVKVSQNNPLRLMLPVPEEDVAAIHNGQHVTVDVPALHRTFDGTITRFADRVQMSTRTMTAEVDVKNPQLTLIPGMYAEVKLGTAEARECYCGSTRGCRWHGRQPKALSG